MSAWAELVNTNDSAEWLELCSRALEEVQRETSRRNAAKIRTSPGWCEGEWMDSRDREHAADLIDPEVP